MSVDLSKVGYGVIVGSKDGVTISKVGYGVIVQTVVATTTRRRQIVSIN